MLSANEHGEIFSCILLKKLRRLLQRKRHFKTKLTVFLELRSRKTVRFSEQIMSADKYPSIFSRQMKAIVYLV